MDISTLISNINSSIYENSTNAITGTALNSILKEITNTLNNGKADKGGEVIVIDANYDLGHWLVQLDEASAKDIYDNYNENQLFVVNMIGEQVLLCTKVVKDASKIEFHSLVKDKDWILEISSSGDSYTLYSDSLNNDVIIPITYDEEGGVSVGLTQAERLAILFNYNPNKNYKFNIYFEASENYNLVGSCTTKKEDNTNDLEFTFVQNFNLGAAQNQMIVMRVVLTTDSATVQRKIFNLQV